MPAAGAMRIKPLLIASARRSRSRFRRSRSRLAQPQPAPADQAPAGQRRRRAARSRRPRCNDGDDLSSGGADETAVEEVSQPSSAGAGRSRRSNIPAGRGAIRGSSERSTRRASGLGDNPWGDAERRLPDDPDAADGHAARARAGRISRFATPSSPRRARRATSTPSTGSPSAPGCCCGWARPTPRGCSSPASIRDRFTPKMVQVAVQSALANADAAGAVPARAGIRQYESQIRPLVQAMCAALAGDADSASAQIDDARRHGRIGGIDLVAAAEGRRRRAATGRAATIDWDPVDSLTAWRFGLAAATGMAPPDRLMNAASPQLRAFEARAPLLSPQQRLALGADRGGPRRVLVADAGRSLFGDLRFDRSRATLPTTDAWQLRAGVRRQGRAGAARGDPQVLGVGKDRLQKEGDAGAGRARGDAGRSRSRSWRRTRPTSSPRCLPPATTAPRHAGSAQWSRMDDEDADRCWAMLALGAPDVADVGSGPDQQLHRRDKSRDKVRSALLVAGLAGLGRISTDTADSLNRRYGLGLGTSRAGPG